MPETNTSAVEVTHVSTHGFWLMLNGEERLLPFVDFPGFKKAQIEQLTTLECPLPITYTGHCSMSISPSNRSVIPRRFHAWRKSPSHPEDSLRTRSKQLPDLILNTKVAKEAK